MGTSKRKRNNDDVVLKKDTAPKRTRHEPTKSTTRSQSKNINTKKPIKKKVVQRYVDESDSDFSSEEEDSNDSEYSDYTEDSSNNTSGKSKTKPTNNKNEKQEKEDKKRKPSKKKMEKEVDSVPSSENENDSDKGKDGDDNEDDDIMVITAEHFNPPKYTVPVPKSSPFPDAIPPATLIFLSKLIANNNKDFVKVHMDDWTEARKDFLNFVELLAKELHEIDPTVLIEPPKNAIYRLNRDLRFSPDRIPYKEYIMASFTTHGKKSELPGYHLKIKPGNQSTVAVGIFQPSSVLKQRMRSGMIRQGNLLRESLETDAVKSIFGENNVGMQLLDNRDKLKVAPKGIAKDHPEIELLKFNSVFVWRKFDDIEVVSEGFLDKILDTFDALLPFVTVLNSWIV